ncbi:MAG: hypothetical protein ACYSWS_09055 [Planctomycetota bacterium]|jgi:hypothetical protein
MTSIFKNYRTNTTFINFVITAPSKSPIDLPVWIARTLSKGEINITSVEELVTVIKRRAAQHNAKIGFLTLYAHASPKGVAIGNDVITSSTFSKYADSLRKISNLFVPKVSFVHFASCQLGQNASLLSRFSIAWNGATVRGYINNQRAEDEWPLGSGPHVTCELQLCKPSQL